MYGLGIAKGMIVTFKHLFRKPFTVQYPEEMVTRGTGSADTSSPGTKTAARAAHPAPNTAIGHYQDSDSPRR